MNRVAGYPAEGRERAVRIVFAARHMQAQRASGQTTAQIPARETWILNFPLRCLGLGQ